MNTLMTVGALLILMGAILVTGKSHKRPGLALLVAGIITVAVLSILIILGTQSYTF